jgi:hypothetical protein
MSPLPRSAQPLVGKKEDHLAFGYKYWMVYLPEVNLSSFLLFVHNPAGSAKLRDYSTGQMRVVGHPPVQGVLSTTIEGKTRFVMAPHPTEDVAHWRGETESHNRRYLGSAAKLDVGTLSANSPVSEPSGPRRVTRGGAIRGSQKQLQVT